MLTLRILSFMALVVGAFKLFGLRFGELFENFINKPQSIKTQIAEVCLIVLLVIAGLQIKGGYDKYQNALASRPLEQVISELQSKENYTPYEDVPEIYYKALVAVEDRRFYKHNEFDIIGTGRAIYSDFKAWELLEGGSTIRRHARALS